MSSGENLCIEDISQKFLHYLVLDLHINFLLKIVNSHHMKHIHQCEDTHDILQMIPSCLLASKVKFSTILEGDVSF